MYRLDAWCNLPFTGTGKNSEAVKHLSCSGTIPRDVELCWSACHCVLDESSMFVLGDLCCDETVRLFEYLHGVYCRKKGEIHLDTLAVASAWSLSLHCLQRHQEAAELQELRWDRVWPIEFQAKVVHWIKTGGPARYVRGRLWKSSFPICSIRILLQRKEVTLVSLREKVGNSHPRSVTERLFCKLYGLTLPQLNCSPLVPSSMNPTLYTTLINEKQL